MVRVDVTSFRFDGFELDAARYELRSSGASISIEPRAFDLLHHLVVHRDRVVPKEELFDSLWGDRFVGEAALTTALRTARIAIGDSGKEQRLIRTVLRRGYQFVGNVLESSPTNRAAYARLDSLPARLGESSGLGFAGRDDERAILEQAYKEVATSGQRQVVFVSGEAGIGKTTLCSVVAAGAHRDGALVLYGRCDDELSIPYQPWREVIAGLRAEFPDVIADRGDALGPLVGLASGEDVDSDSARFALFSAVVDVLDTVTADGPPALIVLDDLHWADVQTLAVVRHLLQRAMATPVLVVATFRDSDIDPGHPLAGLLATAHREPGCTRLALSHLDDAEMLTLLEIVAGHEMDHDGLALRDALRAETAGNPFFVTEILRHLTETGVVRQTDDGRWIAPADIKAHGLPISVREVVNRRVEHLGAETRTALDTASVIGRDFDLELLASVLDEPPARTFERLTPAVANALVSDAAGGFSFAHAIVGHTLYEELSHTARAFLHEAIAAALEQLSDTDERAGEIAHHWARAIGPSSAIKAAEFALRAGDHALAQLAPDEAVTFYRQALDLTPDSDARRRCVVLVGLGTAQRQAGDPEHRETLLEAGHRAIDLGDDDLLVRAALANNRGEVSRFGEVDEERIQILEAAIAVRPDGPDSALLHAILGIEMHDGSDRAVHATAAHALDLARAAGDDRILARVVRLAESSLQTPDALTCRYDWLQEGIAAAERSGDPILSGMMSMSHHEIAVELGDRDAMERERIARAAFARRSPEPFVRWTNEQTRFTHHFLDGDLEQAEDAAGVAFELGVTTGQPEAFFAYAGQLFQLRRTQDRLAEVADELEQFVGENASLDVFSAGLAFLCCEVGRESEARSLADEISVSRGEAPQFWSTTLMLWAEVCHMLALPEPAARLVPVLDGWKNQVASTGATTEGSIAHGLGRALATVGRTDEAAEAYDLAIRVNGRLRAPLFVAASRLAQAELFVEGQPERSRDIATDVLASTAHLDLARIRRLAGQLLDRLD